MYRGELESGKTATEVGRVRAVLETPIHRKPGNCVGVYARFQRKKDSHLVS